MFIVYYNLYAITSWQTSWKIKFLDYNHFLFNLVNPKKYHTKWLNRSRLFIFYAHSLTITQTTHHFLNSIGKICILLGNLLQYQDIPFKNATNFEWKIQMQVISQSYNI